MLDCLRYVDIMQIYVVKLQNLAREMDANNEEPYMEEINIDSQILRMERHKHHSLKIGASSLIGHDRSQGANLHTSRVERAVAAK